MFKPNSDYKFLPIFTIPAYLIQNLGDSGAYRTFTTDETGHEDGIENDDLRIHVEILGGHTILIPPQSRLVLQPNGDLVVEHPI